MRTKVKTCGITQAEQAKELVDLGVDAIGMILHADSPRLIGVEQAKAIRAEVPAFVTLVGVFVDCDMDQVNRYVRQISLDVVQLHGNESEDYAMQLAAPYIKAIRAKSPEQVAQQIVEYPSARALLFDPYVPNQHGGTGQRLAADLWPAENNNNRQKLILAGGLSSKNLADAVTQFRPYAVDLNSGVEDSPGIKNCDQVAQCMRLLSEC